MRTHSSSFSVLSRSASIASVGLLSALLCWGCSGSSDSSGSDDDSTDQGNTEQELPVDNSDLPDEQGLPLDTGNAAGGTMLNIFDLLETEECSQGWIDDEGETPNCNATFRGICFPTDADACECAGCGDDLCLIAESFPTQISCEMQGLPGVDQDLPSVD